MVSKRAICLYGVVLLVCAVGAESSGSPVSEFRTADSRQATILSEPCPASEFPNIQLFFGSSITSRPPGTVTGIRCLTEVRNGGEPVRGVPITMGGSLIDSEGDVVAPLAPRSGTTNRAGQKTFTFPYSVPPPGSDLGVLMEGLLQGDLDVDSLDTTCAIIQRQPCRRSATTACLSGGRFQVEVDVSTPSGSEPARIDRTTKNEALFYFFNPGSTDLLVQLLQRCTNNDHFWVFASATTDVAWDMTIVDTFTGESRAYDHLDAVQPILDTAAFATCP